MNSFSIYQSPVGNLLLQGDGQRLLGIQFLGCSGKPELSSLWQQRLGPFKECMAQLDAYFCGQRNYFELPLTLQTTPFRKKVLAALQQIPYGKTCSYGEIAAQVGNPQATRAVGGAAHCNPIPIIIPCHRLIGASGQLTGFAAGLKIKKYLLDLEKKHL